MIIFNQQIVPKICNSLKINRIMVIEYRKEAQSGTILTKEANHEQKETTGCIDRE